MALVITRRVGEALVIGENIKVTVVGVNGQQVRIAVDAPKEVEVDREEIRERKKSGLPHPKDLVKHGKPA